MKSGWPYDGHGEDDDDVDVAPSLPPPLLEAAHRQELMKQSLERQFAETDLEWRAEQYDEPSEERLAPLREKLAEIGIAEAQPDAQPPADLTPGQRSAWQASGGRPPMKAAERRRTVTKVLNGCAGRRHQRRGWQRERRPGRVPSRTRRSPRATRAGPGGSDSDGLGEPPPRARRRDGGARRCGGWVL
jgi:hypothetical protein